MFQKLRLTDWERQFNDYYDSTGPEGQGRRGVLCRRYPYRFTIDSSNRAVTVFHKSGRRSRIHQVTFTGDVFAVRVAVTTSTGETYTVDSVHLPALAGSAPLSTANQNPAIVPPYVPAVPTSSVQFPTSFIWTIDPNWVLPGSKQLQFQFTLEDPFDTRPSDAPYGVAFVVTQWEFPGFEGGAV